jgi:hypothetical protein
MSAWCRTTISVGAAFLQSIVLLDVSPKPIGMSDMLYTTTPAPCGVFSVIRPSPAFSTWFPYRNDISDDGLTHTLWRAYRATSSRHEMCRWKFLWWVNLPKQTPRDARWSRPTFVARRITASDT